METSELLTERQKTHGRFEDNARITQALKEIIRAENQKRLARNQRPLLNIQIEALELMCGKISRILAGDPNYPDHWHDAAGYAMLFDGQK